MHSVEFHIFSVGPVVVTGDAVDIIFSGYTGYGVASSSVNVVA